MDRLPGDDARRRWRRRPRIARSVAGALSTSVALVSLAATAADRPSGPASSVVPGTPTAAGEAPAALQLAQRRSVALPSRAGTATIVHETWSLHGIAVHGAYRRVAIAPDGRTRVIADRRPTAAAELSPDQARLSAGQAAAVATAWLAARDRPAAAPTTPPTLVYLLVLGRPVLSWQVDLPLQTVPEPSRPRLWVSAATGRVLDEEERVLTSRARVFRENPAKTPEPIEVELDVAADGPGAALDVPSMVALHCAARPVDEPPAWWDEGDCYPVTGVTSDDAGDFFVPLPDIVRIADNVDPDDPYAQVSMFWHAQRFFDFVALRGYGAFSCERATLLANFRELEPSGSRPYTALDNAYYTGDCEPERGPTMIFGQGSEVDFGFDGDVVYHELGHGMVAALAPEGLAGRRLRADGSLVDAGGINEAIADYFAIMLTDDPHLGEYVGRFWSSNDGPYIRTADNTRVCPDNMVGQVHNDGEPMSAALWATRKRVGPVLDDVVVETLTRLPPDATHEEASATLLAVAAEHDAQGLLPADAIEILHRALATRGLLDCPRVIADPKRVITGVTMHLRKVSDGAQPFFPGPLQLRWTVPEGVDHADLSFRLVAKGSSKPVYAHALVRRADTPITFSYDLVAVDDPPVPDEDGELPDDTDAVRELILVSGDWDLEIEPTQVTSETFVAPLTGLREGEVLHVAVANVTTIEAVASSVAITTDQLVPPPLPEAETDGEPAEGTDIVGSARVASSGCTCRAVRDETGRGLLLLPVLFFIAVARRR